MEAEEDRRRKERNAFVILLCCVSVDVCSYVRTYGSAESIVACVSFIRFLFFLFSTISLSLSPSCAVLWMMDSFVSKLSVLLQGLVVYDFVP